MCNKKGFSLLSFLLYLTLFTMIIFFSCHIIVSLIIPSFSAIRTCKSIIALHIASDLFVRDVRAIKDHFTWKLITSHELIWQTENHDIGWYFSDNRLERKEGVYNREWKHKTTSVIATGIQEATFFIEKNDKHIIGINLILIPTVDIKPVVCYATVNKREKT